MPTTERIGIRLSKVSELKCLSPVIKEIINRDIPIYIFSGPDPENSYPKNIVERPIKNNLHIANLNPESIIYFQNYKDFKNKLINHKISDLITLNFSSNEINNFLRELKEDYSIKIHCIQSFLEILDVPLDIINLFDNIFSYGDKTLELYKKANPSVSPANQKKFINVGNPMLDNLSKLDKPSLKRKYNIPENKPVVLFLSANPNFNIWRKNVLMPKNKISAIIRSIKNRNFIFIKDILTLPSYKKTIKTIENWTQKNNAQLIVKTKLKHKDPSYIKNIKAIFFSDNIKSWFPYITIELLEISDIVIAIDSSMALEAIPSNCYSITLRIFDRDYTPTINERISFSQSFYKNKNLCLLENYKNFPQITKKYSLSDFKVKNHDRDKFIKEYLFQLDGLASKRIIDNIINT